MWAFSSRVIGVPLVSLGESGNPARLFLMLNPLSWVSTSMVGCCMPVMVSDIDPLSSTVFGEVCARQGSSW